jgi:autotransporter-associated beta strand protein
LATLIAGLVGAILLPAPAARANDYTWNNAAGGNWNVAGSWTPGGGPPAAADNATISTAGTYTVTLDDNRAITNLTINNATATLSHTAGTLTLGSTLALTAGTYSLAGGTISGGTITSGGGQLQLQNNNLSALNNVAVGAGVLDFSAAAARVRLQGTTALAAGTVLNLSGSVSLLTFEQTATVGGAGSPLTINLGSAGGTGYLSVDGNNNILTLGPAATVTSAAAGGGGMTSSLYSGNPATLRNQGLIQNTGTGTLTINPFLFANQSGGTVRAQSGVVTINPTSGGVINAAGGTFDVNGGTLNLTGPNWSSQGTITVSSGTLNLGGSFATAGLAITRTGGVVTITGAADNTANTLALTAATGSYQLNGGSITGGAVTAAGGSALQLRDNNANVLNNVAVGAGVLDFSVTSARVRLQGTTALAAGTVVNLSGTSSILAFEQTATANGLTVNLTAAGGAYLSVEGNNTLTLGPATTITNSSAATGVVAGGLYAPANTAVVNQGLAHNTGSGELLINPSAFTNSAGGIVRAESGTVNIPDATNLTNFTGSTLTGGTWEAWGSATLQFGNRSIATLAAGTTVILNGPNPTFAALNSLTTNNGTLRVLGGKTFTPTAATVTNAGVIEVGAGSTFAKAINIQAGGRLEGAGTVGGAVTVAGVIAPGNAAAPIGTLTTGSQTWAGGGVYEISYGKNHGSLTPGTDNDYLTSPTGALAVTATPGSQFLLRMNYTGPAVTPTEVTIKIATFGGGVPAALDPSAFQLVGDIGGSAFQLTPIGNDVFLTFTPVPEPGSLLLVGAAGSGVFVVVRRLRRAVASRTRAWCNMSSHWARVGLVGAVVLLAGRPATGQSYTWAGSLDGNWSTPGNWSPAAPPTSSVNTALTFGATGNPTMTNDLAGTFSLNSLTFTAAAPAYTLGGNPLAFQLSSFLPAINQNSSSAVTINNNISTPGFSVQGTGTGTVTLNGAISGSGYVLVNLSAAGTVVLGGGSNTYTGTGFTYATNVLGGTLQLGNGNAIPTGTHVYVTSGATFNTGGLSNSAATAIGTLYVGGFGSQGGTFRVPSGSGDYYLNKLSMTGGTVDFTGTTNFWLHFTGAGAGITTNASSTTATWIGAAVSRIQNDTAGPLTITVAFGSTASGIDLDAGITLSGGGFNPNFTLAGGGTMRLTSLANSANITVAAGVLRVDDAASNGGVGALGTGAITLAYSGGNTGAYLLYGGPSAASAKPITLGSGGGTAISVLTPGVTWTLNGVISQSVPGAGLGVLGNGSTATTLVLNATNTYSGPTLLQAGATLAIPTIANGGVASPIGSSSNAPANLWLGYSTDSGTLLLLGTNPAYSTDRGITVGGSVYGGTVYGGFIGVQNATTNLTVSGQITGSPFNPQSTGNLIKTGPGTLTLTNTTNNYATSLNGGTYVQGGTLAVGAAGAVIPSGSNVVVSPGATFQLGFTSGNNSAAPVGTITLNGGTLAAPSGSPFYFLNQLVTGTAGGTVNLSGSSGGLYFTGAGPAIVVNGNSTFTGGRFILNYGSGTTTIAIAPNVTLTNNITLGITLGNGGYQVTGGGTLYMTTAPTYAALPLTVVQGRVRVDDLSVTGSGTVLGAPGQFTLNSGTLQYSGGNQTTAFPITLGPAGGTVEVSNPATTLTLTGPIGGPTTSAVGPLVKAGPGTLALASTANTYPGGITVNAGVLAASDDAQLGLAAVTVNPAGTLLYTATASTARTFNLTGGTLRAPDGVTVTIDGATVNGGVLASNGSGSFVAGAGGATLNGVTMYNGTFLNQSSGPVTATNLTFGGTHTIASGQTFTLTRGNYTASSQLTVNGTANVTDFTTVGKLSVVGTGQLVNTGTSPLVFGGGSVTTVGVYNPTTGQVTSGGKISLGAQDLVVQGGFVRNNGLITSTTGNLVIDAGGLVRGSGTYDVNSIILRNGGQFFSGNSPGLVTVRNLDLTGGSVIGADLSNATGLGGSANPAGFSGWGVTEYGATNLTSGRLTITATASTPAVFKFNTVTDVPPRNTYAAPTNFDRTHAYTWVVFRPGTTAGFAQSGSTVSAANQDDFTTQNTVAQIAITDAVTSTVYSHANGNLTAAVLNQYLRFDPTSGTPAGALGFVDPATGSAILPSVGTFSFVLGPDTLGNPDRVIALVYTPVPEPVTVLVVAAAGLAGLCLVRRRPTR